MFESTEKKKNSKENNTLKYRHHCMYLFESTMHTEFSISIEEIYLHLYLNHKNTKKKVLFFILNDFNFILHYINYIKCLPGMCPHSVCM